MYGPIMLGMSSLGRPGGVVFHIAQPPFGGSPSDNNTSVSSQIWLMVAVFLKAGVRSPSSMINNSCQDCPGICNIALLRRDNTGRKQVIDLYLNKIGKDFEEPIIKFLKVLAAGIKFLPVKMDPAPNKIEGGCAHRIPGFFREGVRPAKILKSQIRLPQPGGINCFP